MTQVIHSAPELRTVLDRHRAQGATVGLVGSSGGLHQGHLSLVRRSVKDGNFTVLWLFTGGVPIETGVLPSYTRDYDRDQEMGADAGADIVFRPGNDSLFPLGPLLVRVEVAESLKRPWPENESGVFVAMVATMMAKAINVVGPCRLYCGEKDWQNVATLKRMVEDLSIMAEIVPCPSVREADGLVMGSRNVKLTSEERQFAPRIKQALDAAVASIESGENDPDLIEKTLREQLAGLGTIEYAVVVDGDSLQPIRPLKGEVRILVSVQFSQTNLMDNVAVTVPSLSSEPRDP
jgi:pantoate--beta-alanine ligase